MPLHRNRVASRTGCGAQQDHADKYEQLSACSLRPINFNRIRRLIISLTLSEAPSLEHSIILPIAQYSTSLIFILHGSHVMHSHYKMVQHTA